MTAPVPAAPARPSSTNTRVLGGLLLVFGTGWMLKEAGVVDIPWTGVVSLVLVALGLAMVVTARTRARSMPLIALGAVLTIGLAIGSSEIGITGGIGDRVYRPPVAGAGPGYRLGVGDLTVDLTGTELVPGDNRVQARVSIGHLLVKVPRGVPVRVDVDAGFGNATVFGDSLDIHGRNSDRFTSPGYDEAPTRLHLVLKVGVGQIEVQR